jgi:uncharacterized protein YndB with AHSA1/START domain
MVWVIVLLVIGVIAILFLAVGLIGRSLPKGHSVTRTALLPAPPDHVWAVISDFANEAQWNRTVKESKRIADHDGHEVWLVVDRRGGKMPLETTVKEPPARLVRRIADPKLPFGGQWTITLASESGGTRVSVTEDGEVYNPFFRFMSRFFMDPAGSIETYLSGLSGKLDGGAGASQPRTPSQS